jgi:hypothetical protein
MELASLLAPPILRIDSVDYFVIDCVDSANSPLWVQVLHARFIVLMDSMQVQR